MSTNTINKRDIFITPHSVEERERRNEFIGFMVLFYAVPVLLMYFDIFPFGSHNIIIPLMGLLILAYTIEKEINFKELGFSRQKPLRGLLSTLSVTAVMFTALIIASRVGITAPSANEQATVWFLLYYVFISAPIQEFIFRSVMHYEFGLLYGRGRKYLKIFSSAVVFSLSHAFFHSVWVLIGTFILGLIWGSLYSKYRNWWPIAASHAILGALAINLGVI